MRKLPNGTDWDEFHDDEIVDWKRVRSAIEHENQLTNHRFTWLLTSQGFLFAAFALVFQASTKIDVKDDLRGFYQYILSALAITGVSVSLYLRLSLRAAEDQHEILKKWWEERIGKERIELHPPMCGNPTMWLLGEIKYHNFPILFVISWIIFILIVLFDFIRPYANMIGTALLIIAGSFGILILGIMIGRSKSRNPSV